MALISNLVKEPIDLHYWEVDTNSLKIIHFNEDLNGKSPIRIFTNNDSKNSDF